MNNNTNTIPSPLVSSPSIASKNGKISVIHMNSFCFVKIFFSILTFFPTNATVPIAKLACIRLVPNIAASPIAALPAANPVSELINSGLLAATAIITSPIIASLNPNFFA